MQLSPESRVSDLDLRLAEDRHPAAGVPERQGGAPPVAPPTAAASTLPASAQRLGRWPAEAVAPVPTASGAGAAGPTFSFEELLLRAIDLLADAEQEARGGHLDPVLAIALRRIELLELGIARGAALLPSGAVRSRLVQLIPGRSIPSEREVLVPEWSAPQWRAAREALARRGLIDGQTLALAETFDSLYL
jgi:hypothetical protein